MTKTGRQIDENTDIATSRQIDRLRRRQADKREEDRQTDSPGGRQMNDSLCV